MIDREVMEVTLKPDLQKLCHSNLLIRDETIMLKNSPFMQCWNASNYVQLWSCCVPIMLTQQVTQLAEFS